MRSPKVRSCFNAFLESLLTAPLLTGTSGESTISILLESPSDKREWTVYLDKHKCKRKTGNWRYYQHQHRPESTPRQTAEFHFPHSYTPPPQQQPQSTPSNL